eukprot:GFUD01000875.1.p1 GENE.GFUD01000875.1~~GFUD01000875.1.p1  ORF type:complete len:537 (-),score=144.38 GFUD01000875.1:131-1690(-)
MTLKRFSTERPVMVSKRLNFGISELQPEKKFNCDTELEEESFCLNFSPCRTRSGVAYDSGITNNDSQTESNISCHSSESRMFVPLEDFESDLSPINKIQMSPCFKIHRRERTSTQIVENKMFQKSKNKISPKTTNTNPFLSSSLSSTCRKRHHSLSSDECDSDDSGRYSPVEMKKLRVSDLSISRYEEEFVELEEVASGGFGAVKLARHRLDGMDYAIKVSKGNLRSGSYEEKKALNEVFAHATLNSHKHVVRYYNSWVEDGHVYIQNEFCQGGSLSLKIEDKRISGENFSEDELKKMLVQSLKGLQYIHSKQLAHLDIKPENIFISIDQVKFAQPDQSTDSGAESEDPSNLLQRMDLHERKEAKDGCDYKIGDLGHVAPIHGGDLSPEEGDCRYMAPEFLLMDMDLSQLDKADIFSLGLTIYEAASLTNLPRNSLEDPEYESLKQGQLPYLSNYSEQFNNLVSSMVRHNPSNRPTTTTLLASSYFNTANTKSMSQLYKEIREAKLKLKLFEQQLLEEC